MGRFQIKNRGLLSAADQGDHDALDLEFLLRDEVGVAGIFGAQKGFAALHEEGFEGDLAVDEGGHDVAGARLEAVFDDDDVVINDVFADHGIAVDLEAESACGRLDAKGVHVNEDAAFLFLGGVVGAAGGNGAVDGDGDDAGGKGARGEGRGARGDDLEGAGAAGEVFEEAFVQEGLDMAEGGVGAAEAEMRGDVAQRWGEPVGVLFPADEIQDLFLPVREFFHTTGH